MNVWKLELIANMGVDINLSWTWLASIEQDGAAFSILTSAPNSSAPLSLITVLNSIARIAMD